jgi:hypothetical protein
MLEHQPTRGIAIWLRSDVCSETLMGRDTGTPLGGYLDLHLVGLSRVPNFTRVKEHGVSGCIALSQPTILRGLAGMHILVIFRGKY